MDDRLKALVKEYDEYDFQLFFMQDKNESYRYTEVDINKVEEQREKIFEELHIKYGVIRDEWGDLFMPDGTPIPLED